MSLVAALPGYARALGPVVTCGATLAWPLAAGAQTPPGPCADVGVTIADDVPTGDFAIIERQCVALGGRADRDGGARFTVSRGLNGKGFHVALVLADGRTAMRDAKSASELAAILEALGTVPAIDRRGAATDDPTNVAQSDANPTQVDAAKTNATGAEPPAAKAAAAAPSNDPGAGDAKSIEAHGESIDVSFDVAVLGALRLEASPALLGIGLLAEADADIDHGWLVGARARLDPVLLDVEHGGGLESIDVGGGLEVGRRIRFETIAALDLGIGVDLLALVPLDGPRRDSTSGDVRPRAFGKVRVPGDGVSFIGELGLELSPIRIAEDHRNGGPVFGVELAAGVTWGGL